MKRMTLAEFIESETDETVFIVDGPQPMVGTGCVEAAQALREVKYEWTELAVYDIPGRGFTFCENGVPMAEHDHHFIKAHDIKAY